MGMCQNRDAPNISGCPSSFHLNQPEERRKKDIFRPHALALHGQMHQLQGVHQEERLLVVVLRDDLPGAPADHFVCHIVELLEKESETGRVRRVCHFIWGPELVDIKITFN